MKIFLYCLFLLALINLGCARIIILIQDIRSPIEHTPATIAEFIKEKKISPEGIYLLKEEFIVEAFIKSANKAFLFNNRGLKVIYDYQFENKKCLGNIENFLRDYQKGQVLLIDSAYNFSEETNRWLDENGNVLTNVPPLGQDFTLVYYWNTFSGNNNHRNFFRSVNDIIASRPDLSIRFYKVNQDFREGVDLEEQFRRLSDTIPQGNSDK